MGPLLFIRMNIVNVGYHSTNYYALDIKDGKLLVDCGWPNTMPQFTAELKRKGIAPTDIKYTLATHFHPDHAGLIEEFKTLGAQLILLENQIRAIEPPPPAGSSGMAAFIHVSPRNTVRVQSSSSREFLATLGLRGEIIPTPGHSDDSITLILDEGYAFIGDLPPRMMAPEGDTVTRGSWDRIYQRQITRLFPAHGT